jgi:hypothetical protein
MSEYIDNVRGKLKPLLSPILMAFEDKWTGYTEAPKVFKKGDFDKELDKLVEEIIGIFKEERKKLEEKQLELT